VLISVGVAVGVFRGRVGSQGQRVEGEGLRED
jgi:hypothetical protein